jgi:hypothetical protein
MSHPSSQASSSSRGHNTYTLFSTRIPNKHTFVRLCIKFTGTQTSVVHKTTHLNFLGGTLNEVVPVSISIGVLKSTALNDMLPPPISILEHSWQREYTLSPQECLFFLSATPFCSSKFMHVV